MASDASTPRRLRRLQDADLDGKVVLVRVDHNCVRRGALSDSFRVDATVSTLYNIVERGGRPILMTHVGRPWEKKNKKIDVKVDSESVTAVVRYLHQKLGVTFAVPEFRVDERRGIVDVDTSVNWLIQDLKARRIGGIYLPNTRWFAGEEGHFGSGSQTRFATQLAGLADVFVNDAFGSWQPHTSTFLVTKYLPSYAGLLMQKELKALDALIRPARPFLAIVAGAKLDTKIGTVKAIAVKCDHLILGGQLYNAYVAAKFGVTIKGVAEEDVELARTELLLPEIENKLLPLSTLVECEDLDGCGCVPRDGMCGASSQTAKESARGTTFTKPVHVRDMKPGDAYAYFLDVAPESFAEARVKQAIASSKTVFVNAVMGLTSSGFHEGTEALDAAIAANTRAKKYFGGGDTIAEFKSLSPGLYMSALDDPQYYLFTGGGTVLKALEMGGAEGLVTVDALMEDGDADGSDANREKNTPKCMQLETCDCGASEGRETIPA
jgi:phosphoglycerate kinase